MSWSRCDACGKYIPLRDIESGMATRKLITPDSEFSEEEFDTLCGDCKEADDELEKQIA